MAFGRKTGSLKRLKESLAKGGNGTFIKYVPKNGELNVRFIQEPEEWIAYQEHYDQTLKASYPCNGERDCPGCISGERKSNRYLANVVNLDDQDRVIALQLPKDLANRLVIKYEKWGSLTDRDIELSRSGDGLDTVYDFDAGVQDRKSIAKYQPLDLLKVLEDVYNAVFHTDEADDEEDEKPAVRKGRAKSTAAPRATSRRRVADTEDDEDDDEDDEPTPAPKSRRRPPRHAEPEPEEDDDEDPEDDEDDEPAPAVTSRKNTAQGRVKEALRRRSQPEPEPEEDDEDDDPDGDEEVEFDEEDLLAMTLGQLRGVARDLGIDVKGKDKPALIELILDAPPY